MNITGRYKEREKNLISVPAFSFQEISSAKEEQSGVGTFKIIELFFFFILMYIQHAAIRVHLTDKFEIKLMS